jgi:hypothetical protein
MATAHGMTPGVAADVPRVVVTTVTVWMVWMVWK